MLIAFALFIFFFFVDVPDPKRLLTSFEEVV